MARSVPLALETRSDLNLVSTPLSGRKKPHREELPAGENLCAYCTAKCCRYYALPMDTPETWKEFDFLRWFLLHDGATVFTDEGTWYLLQHSKCRHLGEDQLCGIYHHRPQICRKYSTTNCEYEDSWVYEQYWELPEQVQEYAEALLGPRVRDRRSERPVRAKASNGRRADSQNQHRLRSARPNPLAIAPGP